MLSAHLEQQIGESDTSFMMAAAAAKEVPDSSSNHSRDDSSSGGDGSSSLSNHTVILGWNPKLVSLVRQLAMANHSLGGGVIAVLADKDTQQMEEEMKSHELDLMGTSVIYHTGCPLDNTSLQKVAVSEARATIILAETNDAEEVAKVQTLLASVATESKFRVVISLHVGFVLHMVLMCAWNSNGTWLYDMSSLRGAIFLPAVVHT
jgi:hypothetical protein